jgi:DNA polymerase
MNNKQLMHAREEFSELLEMSAPEREFQRLFCQCPYILSRSLPLKLLPEQLISLARPGKSEPDFVFYPIKGTGFDSYGCIELKRPDQPIISVTRKNIAVLSRDAATAVAQAKTYSSSLSKELIINADHSLWLGSGPQAFVIIGLTKDYLGKLTDSISSEALREQIGPRCQILPYDELLRRFEQSLPLRVHVLTPATPIESIRHDQLLNKLHLTIEECNRCLLRNSSQTPVFGNGHSQARLFIIGEAPGKDEIESGMPFVGQAGQYLKETMSRIIPSTTTFFTNVLKCRPEMNRNPHPEEIDACRSYLEQQIELVSPEIIIGLGSTAGHWLLGNTLPVSKLTGTWFKYKSIPVRILHHPALLLRNPALEPDFIRDWTSVATELNLINDKSSNNGEDSDAANAAAQVTP